MKLKLLSSKFDKRTLTYTEVWETDGTNCECDLIEFLSQLHAIAEHQIKTKYGCFQIVGFDNVVYIRVTSTRAETNEERDQRLKKSTKEQKMIEQLRKLGYKVEKQ